MTQYEMRVAKKVFGFLYQWLWARAYKQRGFTYALWRFMLIFAILNTCILIASISNAPAGAYVAVAFLWLCVYLLTRIVGMARSSKKRGSYRIGSE